MNKQTRFACETLADQPKLRARTFIVRVPRLPRGHVDELERRDVFDTLKADRLELPRSATCQVVGVGEGRADLRSVSVVEVIADLRIRHRIRACVGEGSRDRARIGVTRDGLVGNGVGRVRACIGARVGGRIAGALAVDISTEQPAFVPVRAKTVLLATGLTHRLYMNASTPGFMFNTGHCPNCAGGQGLGWRVGARMVNMEFPYTHAGPKYLQRCGKATWIGVYRYPDGKPIGPFATKSDPQYGDVTSDIWNSVFEDVMRKGTGPAYMDCSDATDEQMAYMRWAMTGEGLTALLTYMKKEGIDPQKHGVEFMRYEPILHGRGLDVSDEGETSVPGLFAAGDLVGNGGCGIALAAYLGWEGGMAAAAQAATVDFQPAEETESIRKRMELLSSFMDRPEGADWKDANMALQQIMSDYAPAGPAKVRSETLLNAGRDYLKQLRHSAERQMGATCSHTLMRAAEVLDLMDCGEAIMNAALARQETRANHVRSDFPFTNPLLADKFLTVGLEGDEVVARWRPIRQPVSR